MAEILRRASFRGIPFPYIELGAEIGRRNVLHEYSDRDIPYGEDMGRAARRFPVTAQFFGETADADMQPLLDALEEAGPGILIHPRFGRQSVILSGTARITYPLQADGKTTVNITFVEAGKDIEPSARTDTDGQLEDAADAAQDAANEDFAENWLDEIADYVEDAARVVEEACSTLEHFMAPLDKALAALDRIINAVQRIISAPLNLIARIESRISTLIGKLENPFSGLSTWRKLLKGESINPWHLSGLGGTASSSSNGAWHLQTQTSAASFPVMPTSLANLTRRTLLIEAVRSIPTASLTTTQDVQKAQTEILSALDMEMQYAPDSLFSTLLDLKVAAAESLAARKATAADLATIETKQTMPALVIAYQATGDIAATDDLIARNDIQHPGFVPAGAIEVLKDA